MAADPNTTPPLAPGDDPDWQRIKAKMEANGIKIAEFRLPDAVSLEIKRMPDGYWRVTSPEHPGLYIATQRGLHVALADVPLALAKLIELNDGARS
jgi:hypothetical protein